MKLWSSEVHFQTKCRCVLAFFGYALWNGRLEKWLKDRIANQKGNKFRGLKNSVYLYYQDWESVCTQVWGRGVAKVQSFGCLSSWGNRAMSSAIAGENSGNPGLGLPVPGSGLSVFALEQDSICEMEAAPEADQLLSVGSKLLGFTILSPCCLNSAVCPLWSPFLQRLL